MTAKQLIHQIAAKQQNLHQLKEKLTLLQAQCMHDYVEIITHRKCRVCLKIESIHY